MSRFFSQANSTFKAGTELLKRQKPDKAFKLILEAARKDYLPAQFKLAQLYLSGPGIFVKSEGSSFNSFIKDSLDKPSGGFSSAEDVVRDIRKKVSANRKQMRQTGQPAAHPAESNDSDTFQQNTTQALHWLNVLLESDKSNEFLSAKVLKAQILLDTYPGKEDEVVSLLTQVISSSNTSMQETKGEAAFLLGSLFYSNNDIDKAVSVFNLGFEEFKNHDSLFFLSHIYFSINEKQALEYLFQAVNVGHNEARIYLYKFMHKSSSDDTMSHINELLNGADIILFRRSLLDDCIQSLMHGETKEIDGEVLQEALILKAELILDEVGNNTNENKVLMECIELYFEAGKLGSAEAYLCAGSLLYVRFQQYIPAFHCYERAAKLGSLEAYKNLADMYLRGVGVQQCTKTAAAITSFLSKHNQQPS